MAGGDVRKRGSWQKRDGRTREAAKEIGEKKGATAYGRRAATVWWSLSLSIFSYRAPTRSRQWMADASGDLWPAMTGTLRDSNPPVCRDTWRALLRHCLCLESLSTRFFWPRAARHGGMGKTQNKRGRRGRRKKRPDCASAMFAHFF
nr:hypothetical protein [Pandoravirus belohorizontensis]